MKKNIKLVLCGCTRNVILVGKVAIKIPKISNFRLFSLGIRHNKKEKKVTDAKITANISPVIFSFFGLFIISKRACHVKNRGLYFVDFAELCAKNKNLTMFFIRDAKPCNFGYLNGRLVKIDYGS